MTITTLRTMTVQDVMTPNPAVVHPSDDIYEAARVMTDNGISGVPVVDINDMVVGVVTRTDLLRRCLLGAKESTSGSFIELVAQGMSHRGEQTAEDVGPVGDYMSTDLITCLPHESIINAMLKMTSASVHRVIVVDPLRHLLGIVSSLDLLKHYVEA